MHRPKTRRARAVALLAVVALALAACGGNDNEDVGTQGEEGGGGGKVVKIGVIAPLSGSLSALGQGIKNGVDLAIKQANESDKIPGWTIEIAAEDDTAKPDVGGQVASKLASDAQVAGVVGTLNSSVAESVQPILARANIVQISPANTNPTLTQGADPANKKRPYPSYFRVATTDAIQGPFAANYVSTDLKAKSVFLIHDGKTYGKGLASEFEKQFVKNGGRVAGRDEVGADDKDFSAVVSRVRSARPDLVYYGGEYPAASLLSSQLEQQGVRAPLMGGDGIYDPTFFNVAKAAAVGDLATSVGAPVEQLESAKDFIEAYDAAGYKDAYSAYGGYSYDAASVIIEAMSKVLTEDTEAITPDVRRQIVAEVQKTSIDGVTGKVAFDEYGDTTTKVLTVYQVAQGADCAKKDDTGGASSTSAAAGATTTAAATAEMCWKPVKTDEFK